MKSSMVICTYMAGGEKNKMASGRLPHAGGSDFHHVEELPGFLRCLHSEDLTRNNPKLLLCLDWRRRERSSFLLMVFCPVCDDALG